MQVVCEATQSSSIPVQVGAFECLVKIMQLYYDKMELYMEKALFGVSPCLIFFGELLDSMHSDVTNKDSISSFDFLPAS